MDCARNIGALIATESMFGAPYNKCSIIHPETLF